MLFFLIGARFKFDISNTFLKGWCRDINSGLMRTKWNKCCCCFKREIFSHPSSKYYFSCSIFQGLICHVFLFILLNSLSILQAAPELFCCGATQLQMVRNVLSCWKKKQDISRKWHHLHGNKPFVRLSGQMHKYRATPLWMLASGLYADTKLDGPSSL